MLVFGDSLHGASRNQSRRFWGNARQRIPGLHISMTLPKNTQVPIPGGGVGQVTHYRDVPPFPHAPDAREVGDVRGEVAAAVVIHVRDGAEVQDGLHPDRVFKHFASSDRANGVGPFSVSGLCTRQRGRCEQKPLQR